MDAGLLSCVLPCTLDQRQIRRYLPHRGPALLVDRVSVFDGWTGMPIDRFYMGPLKMGLVQGNVPHVFGIGWYTVRPRDTRGHFPGHEVMPGYKIIEVANLVCAVAVAKHFGRPMRGVFRKIDGAEFLRPVLTGDTLEVFTEVTVLRPNLLKFWAQAFVLKHEQGGKPVYTSVEQVCFLDNGVA